VSVTASGLGMPTTPCSARSQERPPGVRRLLRHLQLQIRARLCFDAIRFARRRIDSPSPPKARLDVSGFRLRAAALGYACRKQPGQRRGSTSTRTRAAAGRPRVVINSHIRYRATAVVWGRRQDWKGEFLYGGGRAITKGHRGDYCGGGASCGMGSTIFAYLFVRCR